MADSMLSLIFPVHSLEKLSSHHESFYGHDNLPKNLPNSNNTTTKIEQLRNNMILIGEANNMLEKKGYATSLLFQACLSVAKTKREVVFISKNKFDTLPLFVHDMPKPDSELLKFIKFKYFNNCEQVIEYLSKIPFEKGTPPSLIILDDIVRFFDGFNVDNELDCIRHIAMISAHAKHAVNILNSKHDCSIIVSCREFEREFNFQLYFDSFSILKTLEKDRAYEIAYFEKEKNQENKFHFKIEDSTLILDSFRITENILNIN